MKKKAITVIGVLVVIVCIILLLIGCTKKNYTITFDSNGGTSVNDQKINKGENASEPTDPTRDGYIFEGWYLDEDFTKPFDFDTKIDKNTKLYAKWTKVDGSTCTKTCGEGYVLDKENCKCITEEEAKTTTTTTKADGNKTTNKRTYRVTSVSLNKSSLRLVVGDSETLKLTINPSYATNKNATWKSSNENVVTVKDGKIVAVGPGKATVTVTVDGKTATVEVEVITQDQANMEQALASMNPKTIEKANTSINYSSNGCSITNTNNNTPSKNTVSSGTVTKVYRSTSNTTLTSNYTVTCGSLSQTKTVNHTILASPYTYTNESNIVPILKVNISSGYSLYDTNGDRFPCTDPNKGAQVATYKAGAIYDMVINGDANTTYAVRHS